MGERNSNGVIQRARTVGLRPLVSLNYYNLLDVTRPLARPGGDMQSTDQPKTDLIRRHLEYLRFYPNSVEAHYNLGLAYVQSSQIEEALREFQKALELRPNMVEALINIGGIFFRQGKIEECIEINQRALEISPQSFQALCNLAFSHIQKEMWEEAVSYARRALETNPESALVHHHLAIGLHKLGRDPEALHHLDRAEQLGFRVDPQLRSAIQGNLSP